MVVLVRKERTSEAAIRGDDCVGLVMSLIIKETVATGGQHLTDNNSPHETVLSGFVVVGVHRRKLAHHLSPGIRHKEFVAPCSLLYLWKREFQHVASKRARFFFYLERDSAVTI